MAQPFDNTMRQLIRAGIHDWLRLFGLPDAELVTPLDADLTHDFREADHLFRIDGSPPWILHLEVQSSHDIELPERLLRYNAYVVARYKLPVHTLVILLRRSARTPRLRETIEWRVKFSGRGVTLDLQIIEIWRLPVGVFLRGGLSALPLALLANHRGLTVAEVSQRLRQRLRAEASPSQLEQLWQAAYIMGGLRYPADLLSQAMPEVTDMRESSTFQAILQEGLAEGLARGHAEGQAEERAKWVTDAQDWALFSGRFMLGEPDADSLARLRALTNIEAIDALRERLTRVSSWTELFADQA